MGAQHVADAVGQAQQRLVEVQEACWAEYRALQVAVDSVCFGTWIDLLCAVADHVEFTGRETMTDER